MKIKYIVYNYGFVWESLHLIRFTNGQGKLYTTKQLKEFNIF